MRRARCSPVLAAILLGCGARSAAPPVPPAAPPAIATTSSGATPATPATAPRATDSVDAGAAPAAGYQGLGAASVPAEVIARHAPPPLPPAVSRRIQAMLDVRGTGAGALTSRGDRMVFTWALTGVAQVWRQDGPMRFPIQLTGGEDRTTALAITRDDRWVIVSRDVGGQENPGLYRMSIEGGPLETISAQPGVQTFYQFESDDGRAIYYAANDRDPASRALYRWDVASKTSTAVFTEPGLWLVADHRGDQLVLSKQVGAVHAEYYRLDLGTGALTPIIGQGDDARYQVMFAAEPDRYLVLTDRLGDHARLYSLAGDALTPITGELGHDVEDFAIDEARRRIYYLVNERGYLRAHALDARTRRELPLRLPPADRMTVAGVSRDGRFAQLTYSRADLPATSVVIDWREGKRVTWRTPSTPEIDVSTFAPMTLESYPARDGTRIPMFVRRPRACTGPCPVIVSFHGGPEGQALAGFSAYGQLFVDAGFTFVEPNVRGSSGMGKAWLHADDGPKRLAVISDLEDCARHLRSAWAVDGVAPRIGVEGGSYGGYATLMAMTYFAGAYDVGVSTVGISNLGTFLRNTAPYRRALRVSEYGDPDRDAEALKQLSPITHVDKLAGPLLIIQGVNDPRVPVGEALQLHQTLADRGVPAGLILLPDEGHQIAKRTNQVLVIGHTIAFFQQHLLGAAGAATGPGPGAR